MTELAVHQDNDDKARRLLGDRLREARKYLGLKQEEVASYLKIPRTALTDIENGQRRVEAIWREVNNPRGVAPALYAQGYLYSDLRRFEQAQQSLESALDAWSAVGDARGTAITIVGQARLMERRGDYQGMKYLDPTRVELDWEFPLAEIILDFYDRLKTLSRGYATLDYEMAGYRRSDLVKLDMLINGDPVDAFSVIIHQDEAYDWGRKLAAPQAA